jgi:polar amino acid transport system substrate-binding protein
MRSVLLMIFAVGAVHAEDRINLHFYVRPPYMESVGETEVTGLTAEPAQAAFEKAGVPFRWRQTPARRQLMLIEAGNGLDCGVGWYKTPDREKFGKFTAPLYRDKPPVVIARAQFRPKGKTLAGVVADTATSVVMKAGLSYGPDVLAIMAGAKAQVQLVTTEQMALVRMVAADRADFMFSPQEEAHILTSAVDSAGKSLKVLTFSDLHEGATRHILCSKKVSDETIEKLNAALTKFAVQGGVRAPTGPNAAARP